MSSEKPEIQLFIKSSTIDRERKGSCPLCQQWFMAACILTEQDILSFHVTIVDAESPPKDFKDLSQSKIFPVVKGIRGNNRKGQDIGDKLADDHERLEEFFESFDCPDLKRDGSVQKHFDDLYKYFNAFLQAGTPQAQQRLVSQLEKLNGFLKGENERYLTKETITYGDCYLMPRLHHIKVAGKEFADFEIPENLFYVWRYLYEAYNTQAFLETCPTDQDIVKHYEKKAKQFKPKKGVPSLQKETFSYDIPQPVMDAIERDAESRPAEHSTDRAEDYNQYANNDQTDHRRFSDPPEHEDHDPGYSEPRNGEIEYENTGGYGGDNSYDDGETGEPMQAASPVRSASPDPEITYEDPDTYENTNQEPVNTGSPQRSASPAAGSPARSASPVADSPQRSASPVADSPQRSASPVTGSPQRSASPLTGSPQRSASPERMPVDGSPSAPQPDESGIYENVDTQVKEPSGNTKSVDFTTPDENENEPNSVEQEYDQVPPMHVNGTNGTDHN